MKSQNLTRTLIGLALLAACLLHASGYLPNPIVSSLEAQLYDLRINLSSRRDIDPRIVIVDIDEKSLKREGRWPWGRDKVAKLVTRLFDDYGVQIIGFDVLFSEPDNSSGLEVLEQLARGPLADQSGYLKQLDEIRPSLQNDRIFADAIRNRAVVLGYYFTNLGTHGQATLRTGQLPSPMFRLEPDFPTLPLVNAIGYGANLPPFQQAAASGGYIDMPMIDPDGILRRLPLIQQYDGAIYESLSLAMVRTLMGFPPIDFVFGDGYDSNESYLGLEWLDLAGLAMPVNEHAAALIPYRGQSPAFNYVSATDVISGLADPAILRDSIVLVGTTAAGLLDLRATPVQNVYPGVEIHANMISAILDGTLKQAPAYVHGIDAIMLIVIAAVMLLFLHRLPIFFAFVLAAIVAAVTVGINAYAWSKLGIVLPIANQAILISALFVNFLLFGLVVENRNKRVLTHMFGQYVPPELVDEMNKKPEEFGVGAEAREMTVLFSDIRDFTSHSEAMQPQHLARLLNLYLSEMTAIIHRRRGTIDKYIGDAIMAFWGAPLPDEKHARHAIEAALSMTELLPQLNDKFSKQGWPELRIGIGLSSGQMAVGNMGSDFRMAYTVMGDTVNLGARLEGLTKIYDVPIIVCDTTANSAPEFVFRELDRVRVKGKLQPVRIFQPLILSGEEGESDLYDWLPFHAQGMAAYYCQDWTQARQIFKELKRLRQEQLYQLYLDRISGFMAKPPGEDWDGVVAHEQK